MNSKAWKTLKSITRANRTLLLEYWIMINKLNIWKFCKQCLLSCYTKKLKWLRYVWQTILTHCFPRKQNGDLKRFFNAQRTVIMSAEFYRGPLKTKIPKLFFAPCDQFLWLRCQQLISHFAFNLSSWTDSLHYCYTIIVPQNFSSTFIYQRQQKGGTPLLYTKDTKKVEG